MSNGAAPVTNSSFSNNGIGVGGTADECEVNIARLSERERIALHLLITVAEQQPLPAATTPGSDFALGSLGNSFLDGLSNCWIETFQALCNNSSVR